MPNFFCRCANLLMPSIYFPLRKPSICPSPCRKGLEEGVPDICLGGKKPREENSWGLWRSNWFPGSSWVRAALFRLERLPRHSSSGARAKAKPPLMWCLVISCCGLPLTLFPQELGLREDGLYMSYLRYTSLSLAGQCHLWGMWRWRVHGDLQK